MTDPRSETQPRMIFHVPYGLNPAATSASGIRPVKMRRAFAELGYAVTEVSGPAAQRRRQIAEIKREVRNGARFDFVYSEASTMPTALTESHHLPTHPVMDIRFLGWCKKRSIPTGVFYRDIYWRYPEYTKSVHPLVAFGTRSLYRLDLLLYRRNLTRIFVPSLKMAREMPHTKQHQCVPLPPGSDTIESGQPEDGALRLFYVGALGAYYRLHESLRGVNAVPEAAMILCTSEKLWDTLGDEYEPLLGDRVEVVHANGAALEPLYDRSVLGCLFLEPIAYREFAAPLKLYEYLGHGKPIIAVEGSLAGDFVAENGVGWVLPYTADALASLLSRLAEDPAELDRVRARVASVRTEHTWAARADQAAVALGAPSRRS